ncbi:MAG TPA: L,D-transpeptidase family protein [Vicinamibacterales bacterium]|nr:L,D-transpeptidase family protein [Vicinamibacterales bacterium]
MHRSLRRIGVVVVGLGLCATSACRRAPAVSTRAAVQPDLPAALQAVLRDKTIPSFVVRSASGRHLWTATREFYQKRAFDPVWRSAESAKHDADELIDALVHSDRDALDPARYRAAEVIRLRQDLARNPTDQKDALRFALLDARLTYLYLQYATDLTTGITDARHRWKIPPMRFDGAAALSDALTRDCVGQALVELQQRDPDYAALRNALQRYRTIAAHGGWPSLPPDIRLKPGARGAAVALLAKRLSITGDYAGPGAPASYDAPLQDAVKRFQQRHGLTPDGAIGRRTIQELNVPAAARVRQIALNMERWRWIPPRHGRRIVVNVPEYRLEVQDSSGVPLSMRVVVGKKDAQTPTFSGEMTYLVFAPFWNVPADIAEKETVPSLLKDAAFLQRTNMEIVDKRGRHVDPNNVDLSDPRGYRFRQRPGRTNSLGLVKFMFPNPYNVYLHDTPADALFTRETRTFSHGCVRLEKPEKLAAYVLGGQPEWTEDRIREAMNGSEQQTVRLRETIPVYITYFTARASRDGGVMFFGDVYGRDGGAS